MSTIVHPDAAPPRWFYKNLARVLVEPAASEGTLGIVEMLGTRGEMPPLHVHHREDEAFVVLDGELSIHLPGGSSVLRAGEALVAPRGISHTYRVETDRARWLAVSTPAGFVSFVEAASDPAGLRGRSARRAARRHGSAPRPGGGARDRDHRPAGHHALDG